MAVVPTTPSGTGCSSGPSRARGNIHLQKPKWRTRPRRRSRIANGQGSSRRFRTSMNTCGGCSRWPAARSRSSQALERAFAKQTLERVFAGSARKGVARVLSGGRHLELWKVGALTCSGGNGLTRLRLWRANSASGWTMGLRAAQARPSPQTPGTAVHERCQRVRFGGAPASRQSCGASLPPGAKSALERGSRSARSRQRVVKRAAVGGPDDRKVVRRRPRKRQRQERARSNRRSRNRASAGFPRCSMGSLLR